MAHNLNSLTKAWIQFLKNNQFVSTESSPESGKLNYKKRPTVSSLIRFLDLNTDFDEESVRYAIQTALKKAPPPTQSLPDKKPSSDVSTWKHTEVTPIQSKTGSKSEVAPQRRNKDAEDIKFSELNEEFYDNQGATLDEDDIKRIFELLLIPKQEPTPSKSADAAPNDEKTQKQQYLRELKAMVRDVMTPQQRKALWRALSDTSLTEATINKADVDAIFKDAAYLRSKPGFLARSFKRFKKDKIDVEDLRKAWADGNESDGSDGYSDDTRDIKRILTSFGFDEPEINKVFARVFNTSGNKEYSDADEPVASAATQRVADLARKKGVDQALKSFLEQEFAEELGLGKKVTHEAVRDIFNFIIHEERHARQNLIKEEERLQLGRTKK